MKKIYIIPAIELYLSDLGEGILTNSPTTRAIGGGPTDAGDPSLPSTVGGTSSTDDPFAGMGVSTGGGGNRSNYGLWDED